MTKIFHQALEKNLASLSERAADIVQRRFGIGVARAETLEAIGKKYDITRERVRQIVHTSIEHLTQQKDPTVRAAQDILAEHVKSHGGIVHIERLVEHFSSSHGIDAPTLKLFIATSKEIFLIEKHSVHPLSDAVHIRDFDFAQWEQLHKNIYQFLQDHDTLCTHDDLYAFVKKEYKYLDSAHVAEHLHVATDIKQNPFGKWGLAQWATVQPRSIRDKVFLILDYHKTPMHFREIAAEIDKYHLNKGAKKTHPQTVHNELIKDKRFVLAGRGMYKLASHNDLTGSVSDLIKQILTQAATPLTFDEIVAEVLRHRIVKPSTVRINLYTVAIRDGNAYTLK